MGKGYVRARTTCVARIASVPRQGCLSFPLSSHIKITPQPEQQLSMRADVLYTFNNSGYTPKKVST